MRITIDIDDTRLLDELNAINGTRSVTRARAKLRETLREAAVSLLVDSGMVDSAIDRIVNDQHRKGIVGALQRSQARSDAMVRRHANAGNTSVRRSQ